MSIRNLNLRYYDYWNKYKFFSIIFLFIGWEIELELCIFDFEYEGLNILYKEV